jgi:hypothetical protein
MTTHSLGQAARLTGRGKMILARAISGRLFVGSKEDDGPKVEGEESAHVYPFPARVERRQSCAPVLLWPRSG